MSNLNCKLFGDVMSIILAIPESTTTAATATTCSTRTINLDHATWIQQQQQQQQQQKSVEEWSKWKV